ncbi:MAG: repeat protein [Pedosphaera sp.]|nr:repeat protein [Pedosphaera sp.]
MRKRSRISLALLLVAVIGAIAWLTLRPNEPMYKGKRLSAWLKVYDSETGPTFRTEGEGADEAVRHIGTNAIPTLLRRLRAKDSPLTLRLVGLAKKQHVFEVKFASAWDKQVEGLHGFHALGTNGKDAVPELIRMYEQDSSPESRFSVTFALGCIGPAAGQAVPMLVRSLGDSKPNPRSTTARTLGQIHSHPEIALPALVKCLNDYDFLVRLAAAEAIGAFGSDAKEAVPDLLKLLADSNAKVQNAAKESLKKIDPEAAAKEGVKRASPIIPP